MSDTILNSHISPSSGIVPTGDVFNVGVQPNKITLKEGESRSLRALGLFENNVWSNATNEVVWASLNDTIADVDATGMLTGVAVGQTIVTAEGSDPTLTGQCLVTVISADPLTTRDPTGKGMIDYGYADDHPNYVDSEEADLPVGLVNKVQDSQDQFQRTGSAEQGQVRSGVQAPLVREEEENGGDDDGDNP